MNLYSLLSGPKLNGSNISVGYSVISVKTSPSRLKTGLILNLPFIASDKDGYFISSTVYLIFDFLAILIYMSFILFLNLGSRGTNYLA